MLSFVVAWTHKPVVFFFFNDTATTEIYTLSLHDALPIWANAMAAVAAAKEVFAERKIGADQLPPASPALLPLNKDRKSTRLNSSHGYISYAVFCLKKKNFHNHITAIDASYIRSLCLCPQF